MHTIRRDAHGHPTAFAPSLRDGLLTVAGSVALVLGMTLAVAATAPASSLDAHALAAVQGERLAERVAIWSALYGDAPLALSEVQGGHEPLDPWGRPWRLVLGPGGLEIISLGADGLPGGDGADTDLRVAVSSGTCSPDLPAWWT